MTEQLYDTLKESIGLPVSSTVNGILLVFTSTGDYHYHDSIDYHNNNNNNTCPSFSVFTKTLGYAYHVHHVNFMITIVCCTQTNQFF